MKAIEAMQDYFHAESLPLSSVFLVHSWDLSYNIICTSMD